MIVSASRRTDIPALYASWLVARMHAGFCTVANPFNAGQIRTVSLRPEDVDAIVLWSKNPEPLAAHMGELEGYPWLLQYTVNDYPPVIEPGVPPVDARLHTFRAFSRMHGPLRVNWRYDPILCIDGFDESAHIKRFAAIAAALEGYTGTCTISFVDAYAGFDRKFHGLGLVEFQDEQVYALAHALARIAGRHGITLSSCAEAYDLREAGIEHGRCVDADRLSRIAGKCIEAKRDTNQRPNCGCAASVDIGRYGTCTNGCLYCYAVKGNKGRRAEATGDAL